MKTRTLALSVVMWIALALPARAQTRLSVGGGAGMAGTTESSLSEGRGGLLLMAQAVRGGLPLLTLGAEFNRWSHDSLSANFATGIVQAHVPLTGFFVKAGVGYGTGDPDGLGKISGATLELGAGYDFTFPGAPVAITLFGNALLSHASSRSLQMVGGGLALTLR